MMHFDTQLQIRPCIVSCTNILVHGGLLAIRQTQHQTYHLSTRKVRMIRMIVMYYPYFNLKIIASASLLNITDPSIMM